MNETDKEVLELCKAWFEEIAERCDKLINDDDISHWKKTTHGFALNCAEFIELHLKS